MTKNTKIFDVGVGAENREEAILIAADAIKNGELVVFPTETVYGLGADAFNEKAVGRIFEAKGRPGDNPLIVHVADIDSAKDLTKDWPEAADKLVKSFWPGPLTLVLPNRHPNLKNVTAGLSTVAVRFPSHDCAVELIKKSGRLIAAPSANLSGRPSTTRKKHVIEDMTGKADVILLDDDDRLGLESTVVDLTTEKPVILRPGWVTKEMIKERTGIDVGIDKASEPEKAKSPGMKYKHYAPEAELIIFEGPDEKVKSAIRERKIAEEKAGKKVLILLLSELPLEDVAMNLFDELRKADYYNFDVILATGVNADKGLGFSVMNRLLKAAGGNVIKV